MMAGNGAVEATKKAFLQLLKALLLLLKMPGNGAVAAAIKVLLLPKMVLFLLLKMAGHGTVLAAKKYTGGYGAAAAAKDDWQRKKSIFAA